MAEQQLEAGGKSAQQFTPPEGITAFIRDWVPRKSETVTQSHLVNPDWIKPIPVDNKGVTVADLTKDVPVATGDAIKPLRSGETSHVTLSDGRKYDIYVPKNAREAMPVMMVLHGANGGEAGGVMERESGMNKLAEERGFVVVYPLSRTHSSMFGENATWNGPGKNLMPTDRVYNDFSYLDSVIKDVATQHGLKIDPEKISAAGMSDGGRIINEYAAARPGLLSAIASVHGTLLGGENPTAKGQPTLIIHSDKDYMLPYGGGRGFMSFLASPVMPGTDSSQPYRQKEYWGGNNGCKGLPAIEVSDKAIVTTYTDTQCVAGPVKEYIVKGGKHAWDGRMGEGGWPVVGNKDPDFETSRVVADFLLQYQASGKKIQRDLAGQLR